MIRYLCTIFRGVSKFSVQSTATFASWRPEFFWLSMNIGNFYQAYTQRPAYGMLGHSPLRYMVFWDTKCAYNPPINFATR